MNRMSEALTARINSNKNLIKYDGFSKKVFALSGIHFLLLSSHYFGVPPPPLRLRLHVMTSKADYQGMCSIRRSNLGWNELNYTFVAKYFCKDCWEFNQLLGLIACFNALIFCSVRVLYIFA